MNIKSKNWIHIALLFAILTLALFLRFYQLTSSPPSLSWDEAAVGYNAWAIGNYGVDEWGKSFPLAFKSFGEYKNPVDIYLTAIAVKIFGLTEFSTRFMSALFGVFNVLLIFWLAKILFRSSWIGIIAAFLLALSPYNIHFSRHNHELNFVLFFFFASLILFFKGLEKKNWLMILSFTLFSVCMISYSSPKLIVPLFVAFLVGIYFKLLIKLRRYFIPGLIIFGLTLSVVALHPGLSGKERAGQTLLSSSDIQKTQTFKLTNTEALGRVELILRQYPLHFTYDYLFKKGDDNPRLHTQLGGQFYLIEGIFLLAGFCFLFYLKQKRIAAILLFWLIIAPLPSAIAAEAPHPSRAMFMLGSWQLIAAFGLFSAIVFFQSKTKKTAVSKYVTIAVILFLVGFYLFWTRNFLQGLLIEYPKKYAIDWQYGMKDSIAYIKKYPVFDKVFITKERSQPYIFFAYYLKIPPKELIRTAEYNQGEHKSSNQLTKIGKYNFGNWNTVESEPLRGVLYILTPTEYSGLRHKDKLEVVELVKYPNGADAYYLVTEL